MRRVLIATGGTGGHLFPAQAAAKELKDCDILFAGHKLQDSPFFDRASAYREIASSNKRPFTLLKGIWQSIKLVIQYKPDVVVGFGSFHSFPVLLAAAIFGKKIVLFEANCSFGKVNKFFSPFAKKIALQFPIDNVGKKAVYVPLLPWNLKCAKLEQSQARLSYGLKPDLFTILVFGGSQGAKFINETFCAAAKLLDFPFQVLHFTGKEDPTIRYDVPAVVKPFEKEMVLAYAAADMAVCRCGAGTTAELIRFSLPSLLIPYPYAYNHQKKNGEFLKDGARILLQEKADPRTLSLEIKKVKEELQIQRDALKNLKMPETTAFSAIIRALGNES